MSDFLSRISHFSAKRLALLADELNSRVQELERSRPVPVAIVGMGCRFPGGADTPEKLWRLLRDQVDAITEVPPDRWAIDDYYDPDPDKPGKMATRFGGFIGPVDGFDPHFFGISPREAHSMDPQQRILLEVVWRALEDAAIAPASLEGSRAGIYLGMSAADYFGHLRANGLAGFDAYTASGIAHSIASGRVAYALGLCGPALSIDTACSSSLVAIYQAMHSLRRGECDLALAGGVNLILAPDITVALSRSHMMAPDGRCKAFDARADGFVRGEGCGILVLKRLADARAAGDRVIAVIRGGASNQDGRSNGLTAPNGPSQEAVLRDALADAGVSAADVGLIEAHGTGTSLGDPIEIQALARVMTRDREAARPLLVGSLKANVGHLEAAAGVAGVVKLAMALRHREVPGQVHFDVPNPHIPWAELAVRVPTGPTEWTAPDGRRRVGGVSSFGFSGTNVHLILEEATEEQPTEAGAVERPLQLLTVSARSDSALRQLAEQYREVLRTGPSLADAAGTANAGRSHFGSRVAVVSRSAEEAADRLDAWLRGESAAGLAAGTIETRPPRVAFLFTGQGSQYAGMAQQLYESEPVFRETIDTCDGLLNGVLPRRLLSVLYPGPAGDPAINETEYTQPALFAVEYALARMWMSWGVRPAAVLGHSVGEYVAACVAGVFSLEDGLKLVAERGRLMGALPRNGAMAAVAADEARVRTAMAPWKDAMSIGAVNGPGNTVVSGRADAVEAFIAQVEKTGISVTRLTVSHAFHSVLVEPILEPFAAAAGAVRFQQPQLDIISNVSGKLAGSEIATARYWCDHVRAAVRFGPAMETLAASGSGVFLELGPQPVLLGMGRQCLGGDAATWLPSLRRGRGDWDQVLESLAAMYVAGVPVDWASFHGPSARRRRISLPGYPFQRERYWIEAGPATGQAEQPRLHPLLGWEVPQAISGDRLFETRFVPGEDLSYLADHRILGQLLLPSPVYLEMARAAAARCLGSGPLVIEDFTVAQALPIGDEPATPVQLVLAAPVDGVAGLRVHARPPGSDAWRLQASGEISRLVQAEPPSADLAAIRGRTVEAVDVDGFYSWLAGLGLDFGSRFRGVRQLQRRDGEVLAKMQLPDALESDADGYGLHPALLDSCFHVIGAALPGGGSTLSDAFLLLNVERIVLHGPLGRSAWTHVIVKNAERPVTADAETFRADLRLFDAEGSAVAEFEGMHFKRARLSAMVGGAGADPVSEMLYEVAWRDTGAGGVLPSPDAIREGVGDELAGLAARHNLDRYGQFLPGLDRLASQYIVAALRALGFEFAVGHRFDTGGLGSRLGVLEAHRRLFARMIAILAEDGIVEASGTGWIVVAEPPAADPEDSADRLVAAHPDASAEVNLTRRCARDLAAVLRGASDPLALLFPGGSLADAEKLYQESPPARAYNGLIASILGKAATALSPDRPLRVLEIGAGTGSTTAFVLPALAGRNLEYTFTDVSPLFLTRAREKFRNQPVGRYALLDIGKPTAAQGFPDGGYDIVLGANVLHATPDLDVTMASVRRLLAPGGLLVLLEGTVPQRFGDLTVGLLDGWWAYTDTARRQYALMPRADWLELLGRHDFAEAVALPGETPHAVLSQQAVFVARTPSRVLEGRWLVMPDGAGYATGLVAALERKGVDVELLRPVEGGKPGEALRNALTGGPSVGGVIHMQALDRAIPDRETATEMMEAQAEALGGLLETVKVLAATGGSNAPRLVLVTRGAQAATPGEGANPAQATLWGLSHVVAIEHPELRCLRVDLDPGATPAAAAEAVVLAAESAGDDDQLTIRGGRVLVRRLARAADIARTAPAAVPVRPDASYLVTGGLRGLGPRVAEWLADQGARHLVLMGRRPPASPAAWLDRLRDRGVDVLVATGDIARSADLERVLGEASGRMPAVRGVVHSAGALDDGVLTSLTWPRFETVMAAKVAGSWNLHRLAGDLDFLVLFSSGASVAGSAGQANHAAANAFEDALAWYRQSRGQPTVSINWGPWADIGAAADRDLAQPRFLNLIPPDEGIRALELALRQTADARNRRAQLAVFAADWGQLDRAGAGLADSSLFAEVRSRAAVAAADGPQPTETRPVSLRERLAQSAPNRRRTILRDHVRLLTSQVLGLPRPDGLNVEEPLRQLGLDSLMAVELRNLLGKAVGQVLPATITFDHPSVSALSEYLQKSVFVAELAEVAEPAAAQAAPDTGPATPAPSADDLADALAQRLARLGTRESP